MKDNLTKPLRTWSHLAANRRRPTEYEIVSSRVLWNTPNHRVPWKMASATPVIQWIVKNRDGSRLQHGHWDGFRDPDQLIYRTYTLMQDGQERYVDGLLDEYSRNDHDATLSRRWLESLALHYTPARYAVHAVQMASGYLVALAPSSTIANCFMFQAGDQLRWASRIAYRTAELADAHPDIGFTRTERPNWEGSAAWHALVELAERALIAWDWGECFTAVNLVFKPAVDEALLRQYARAARSQGDSLTAALLDAQFMDSQRSRRFSTALARFLMAESQSNREVMTEWLVDWLPLADRAIDAFCDSFDASGAASSEAKRQLRSFHDSLALDS